MNETIEEEIEKLKLICDEGLLETNSIGSSNDIVIVKFTIKGVCLECQYHEGGSGLYGFGFDNLGGLMDMLDLP